MATPHSFDLKTVILFLTIVGTQAASWGDLRARQTALEQRVVELSNLCVRKETHDVQVATLQASLTQLRIEVEQISHQLK